MRICAPNVWAISKEDIDFAHPIFGAYFMYCAPNLILLPPPLKKNAVKVSIGRRLANTISYIIKPKPRITKKDSKGVKMYSVKFGGNRQK